METTTLSSLDSNQQVRASLMKAADTTPEAASEAVVLGQKLGLEPELVTQNLAWARKRASLGIDVDAMERSHPGVARFLQNPNNAAVSSDDFAAQLALEDLLTHGASVEPGLFTKANRDTVISALRSRGHEIGFVEQPEDPMGEAFSKTLDVLVPKAPEAPATPQQWGIYAGGFEARKAIAEAPATPPPEAAAKRDQSQFVQLPAEPAGFVETFARNVARGQQIPFVGGIVQAAEMIDLYGIINRIGSGKATDADWINALKIDAEMRRGSTFGGKAAAAFVEMPAFAIEMATTAGLYTAGRKGSYALAKKITNKSVREISKNFILKNGVELGGWAAGAIAQGTIGSPHRVAARTMQRRLPGLKNITENELGELQAELQQPTDSFLKSLYKAMAENAIEIGSEYSGGLIEKAGASIMQKTRLEAVKAMIMAKWFKLNPLSGWSQFKKRLQEAQWHGILGETGEEFFADVLTLLSQPLTDLETPDFNPEEYLVAAVSAGLMQGYGLVREAPRMVRRSNMLAMQAQAQVEWFKELGENAVSQKVRERVPGMLASLGNIASQNGPVKSIFAPIDVWKSYWTSKGMNPEAVAQQMLGSSVEFEKADSTGADLEIPIGAYVENIAPTEHNAFFAENVRLGSPAASTVVEMRTEIAAQEKVLENLLSLNQAAETLNAESATLQQQIADLEQQIVAAGPRAEQLSARMQEIQAQFPQTPAEQFLAAITGADASPEMQAMAGEYQASAQESADMQKSVDTLAALKTRQAEVQTQLDALGAEDQRIQALFPSVNPEVQKFADDIARKLMDTERYKNEKVARVHGNIFARMMYILGLRNGMTLKEMSERFPVNITGGKKGKSTTIYQPSPEMIQRDAEYMAAVESGDMEKAQRMVDEAAKDAGYKEAWHSGALAENIENNVVRVPFMYFTDTKENAELYDWGNVGRWFIKINPLTVNEHQDQFIDLFNPKSDRFISDSASSEDIAYRESVKELIDDATIEAKSNGRDSIEMPSEFDGKQWKNFIVFDPSQIKSADAVTRDADGTVIPLSERFNPEKESILYQKAVEHINAVSANVLADEKGIPGKIPDELIGKRFAPIMADLLGGGGSMYGVPLQGGPIYAIINDGTGAAWASQRGAVAGIRALLRRTESTYLDKDGKEWGLAAVYAMGQDAHRSNKNTTMVYLSAVEEAVRTGEISKKNEKKLTAMIRANAKATPSIKENSLLNTFPSQYTAEQMAEIIDKLTFDERAWLAEQLSTEAAADLGVPRIDKVLRQTRDESFQSIDQGSIIMLLKIDMERLESGLADKSNKSLSADAFGVEKHLSYDTIIPGQIAVHFRNPVSLDVMAPQLVKDLQEASPKSHVQYLLGRVPKGVKGQTLNKEVVTGVNEVQQAQTRPTLAQAMTAAMSGGWIEYKQGKSRQGLTDFIRAIESSEAAATLTAYDKNQLQNDVKNGLMEVYRLGRFDVWFGIKNTKDGKELVGVVNNSGLPGMLNLIMAKALEAGANRLDAFSVKTDKMPNGMLETLYGRHGWKVDKVEKFNPKYAGEDLPKLTSFWAAQGWDEDRHGMPSVVYMSHDGIQNSTTELPTNPGRRGGDDLGGLADRSLEAAGPAPAQIAEGNAGDRAASAVSPGAAGDAGAGRRVFPRGSDRFIAELRAATESQLKGWGVSKEQRNAVLSAIDSQTVTFYQTGDDPVFPQPARGSAQPKSMSAEQISDWAASHSIEEIRGKLADMRLTPTPRMLEMLGDFPEYLNPVVDFVMTQRRKLTDGKITPREVAKAYYITLASIGADAIGVETIRQRASEIGMEFNPDPMFLSKGAKGQDIMRPEELAAWWFSTPMGQRALNSIEKGTVDREAWEQGLAIRDAFGRNDARERTSKSGAYSPGMLGEQRKKKNLNDILALTEEINATKGDTDKLQQVLNSLQGIGNGKKGFIGHMLGMGSVATIDAVEINVWLTGSGDTSHLPVDMKKRVALAKAGGTNVTAFYERIRKRISELHKQTKDRTNIPDEVAAHIVHHWIWDTAKNAQTTHAGVYEAMRYYQNEKDARGSIAFMPAARGAARREFTVSMLAKTNASTFMHEAAHWYLEVVLDLANSGTATGELQTDVASIRQWLGIQAGAFPTPEQHETFARAFEKYLMEGKAPAEAVRGAFAAMRAWMIRIYRDLRHPEIDIAMSDDIRRVFDRMVATDAEIDAAQRENNIEPLFAQKPAYMNDDEWDRYRKILERASIRARERLGARLESEVLAARKEEREKEREQIKARVEKQLNEDPAQKAVALLRFGKQPNGEELAGNDVAFKLDRDSLFSTPSIDDEKKKRLRALGVYRVTEGVDAEAAASTLGFGSADELVGVILGTKRFADAVNEATEAELNARYPSLLDTPEELRDQANQAVHNELRDEVIAEEMAALARQVRKDNAAVLRVAAGSPLGGLAKKLLRAGDAEALAASQLQDVRLAVELANLSAQRLLSTMELRAIRPAVFLAAAKRASLAAQRAATNGDFLVALGQKEAEFAAHAMYRNAKQVQATAEKQQRYLLRMGEDSSLARLGKAGAQYRDQVQAILDRFQFRSTPLISIERNKALRAWVEERQAKGFSVDIDDSILDEAFRKDFRTMTAAELTAVWEAVKQIDTLAKLKNKLLKARKEAEFEAVQAEIIATISATRKAKPKTVGTKTAVEKSLEKFWGFFEAHRKLASLVREMDGFADGGPLYMALMAPMNEAGNKEAVMNEEATIALQKLFDAYSKEELRSITKKQVIRTASNAFNLSREDRLTIALNWGNEDNRTKLVDGYNGFTEQDVATILDTLTEKDWKFVQSVWDYVDSFWPAIKAKQERVYGIAPEKVEAAPVVTKFGVFRGGYYPLRYTGAQAESESEADVAKSMLRGAMGAATTARGHTKGRIQNVKRPVKLGFEVLTEHVGRVIHDLTHHEALIDANKILKDRSIAAAIETHYGEGIVKQMRRAIDAIAAGNMVEQTGVESAFRWVLTGSAVSGLGFNLMTSLMQGFGLFNAAPRVGLSYVLKGAMKWLGSKSGQENTVDWIYSKSDFMRLRAKTQSRDLSEIRNKVNPSMRTTLMDSYFYMIGKGQVLADVPVWLGAYTKEMQKSGDETRAVMLADQAVVDTQGGGQIKDLASVQRGGAFLKMFTMFYSYFNAAWNQNVEIVKSTDFKSPLDIGRMMVDLLFINSVPVALQMGLFELMRGSSDDNEEWYVKFGKSQAGYFLNQLAFVREFGGIFDGRAYEGPAGARFFSQSYKLAKQIEQGEYDRGFWVAAGNVVGTGLHLPTVATQRMIEGAKALWEGSTRNPLVLIVGPTKEERK